MDSASNSSDAPGKQPASSILNVFSGFFSRDRSASSDVESAVLTSFKERPDGENPLPESGQTTNSENKLKGREDMDQDNATASCDTEQRAESSETCKESGDHVKTAARASVDPDLVQVTRVETYSDTENEDEEAAHSIARTGEPTLPEEDSNTVEHGDGDASKTEYQMPVFRTHKFKERSRVEAILYSDRFMRRADSKTVRVSSKEGDGSGPKGSTSTVSVETSGARTDESNEYDGIDCSLPVPSIISGHLASDGTGLNAATAPPLKQTEDLDSTQKEETHEQRAEAEEGTEEPHSSQVSSSVTSSPKTPEVSVQSSSSPEEQSDSAGITDQTMSLSSAPKESSGDIQPSASPASQRVTAPKTTETKTPPPASSVSPSSTSSTSSPSKGAAFSSPPSFQMPALFSGLRVMKKGAVGEDRETVSEIKQREKDADLALLSLKKTVNKAKLFPEQKTATPAKKHAEPKPVAETKSTVMGQLSHLLNLDNRDETKKPNDGRDADPEHSKEESENGEEVAGEKLPGPETPTSSPEKKKTSDLAYETFRNIFGPKTVKKEKTEDVDLEAVKKKIKNDKENLRSIFERTSKSPSKEVKSPTEANV